MKRGICILLIIFCGFNLVSCAGMSVNEYKTSANIGAKEFDTEKAVDIATEYVKNLRDKKYGESEKLFSDKLKEMIRSKEHDENLEVSGYSVDKVEELTKSIKVTLKVTRTDKTKPFTSLEELSMTVINEDDNYSIDKIESKLKKEVFVVDDDVRIRNEDNIEDFLLIRRSAIPSFILDKENPLSMSKVKLENNKLARLNMDFSGEHMAITTEDINTMVASINIDETLMTAAKEKGDSKGEEKGQEDGSKKEKPVGKEIKVLGLIKDGKVDFLTYSEDNLYLIVQYKKELSDMLKVYDIENAEELKFSFDKNFDRSKFNLIYKGSDKENMKFIVNKKEGAVLSSDEEEALGVYSIEFRTLEINKI